MQKLWYTENPKLCGGLARLCKPWEREALCMLLALDVGNTNITLGVFDGERLLFEKAFGDTDLIRLAPEQED